MKWGIYEECWIRMGSSKRKIITQYYPWCNKHIRWHFMTYNCDAQKILEVHFWHINLLQFCVIFDIHYCTVKLIVFVHLCARFIIYVLPWQPAGLHRKCTYKCHFKIWTLTAALRPGKLKKASGPCLWGIWFSTDNILTACFGCTDDEKSNNKTVKNFSQTVWTAVNTMSVTSFCN